MPKFHITSVHFDNLTVAIGELLKLPGVRGIISIEGNPENACEFVILCDMADGVSIYHQVECMGEGYFTLEKTY